MRKSLLCTLVLFPPLFFPATSQAQSTLPTGWSHRDIGSVGVAGNATYSNGVFTISGSGAQVFGTADALHFAYQPMSGDGTIVARVLSVTGMQGGTNPVVGVMIRESFNANSAHASSVYRTNPLVELLYRPGTGSSTFFVNSGATPLPYWVKVVRTGTTFSSYISSNGAAWTQVGTNQTFSIATNVYIGLAVSNSNSANNNLVTATFDNVSVTAATWTPPPAPWLDQDLGTVGVPGNASYANGVFTVAGSGAQIFSTADGFNFLYQPMSGDGTILARVLSVQGMQSGTNPVVGVMIRESLSAGSRHASSVYRTNPLIELLWRATTGGSSSFVNSGATPLPYWVKVVRSGSTFSSFISPNGVVWTQVGTNQTISMATCVHRFGGQQQQQWKQ